ncbi:MAG TPA: hypothetical protein DDW51_05620 [Cyanobacteria bacterium UBA11367]|nr:hypothetical protein [Cyanobacteria bacterium UBA11367]HBE56762.1 hypothetical protein [Cyanobacteria bacterium UBA11366]
MAQLNYSLLKQAKSKNLIGTFDDLTLKEPIRLMNKILIVIRDNEEINSQQLTKRLGYNHNTILCCCRWLQEEGFIDIQHKGSGGVAHYTIR